MRRSRPDAQRGMSLIEVLIASAIMLFIILGLLPLFTMAIRSNAEGQESTQMANYARERLETLWNLPNDNPLLVIDDDEDGTRAGAQTVIDEHYSWKDRTWKDGATAGAGDFVLWSRRTIIDQFSVFGMAETPPVPLDAGASSEDIHVKRIIVEIREERPSVLGGQGEFIIQAYKGQ